MKTLIAAIALALTSTAALADRYDGRYDDRYYETRYDTRYDDSRYDSRYDRRHCDRCGVVLDINRYGGRGDRHSNAGGTVLGALVGGAIGNQVGKGDGRKAATVAGAVIGGVAGNRIDDRNGDGSSGRYEILVRMDDGRRVVLDQRDLNGVREGSRVYVRNGRARLL